MSEKIKIDNLREHLYEYSNHLQNIALNSSADYETKQLFDELAKYHHYMFSEIIDYLDQQ